MKIVFSRKGFDSSYGGVPSPIFPDGQMISLPVPAGTDDEVTRFCDISWAGGNLGSVVEDLTTGRKKTRRVTSEQLAHPDPDLDEQLLDRPSGWLPAFGQGGAAQSHLDNEGVGSGDLFLFFGWFRQVIKKSNSRWDYKDRTPDLQVLFGWLQVDAVLRLSKGAQWENRYPGLARHPHVQPKAKGWPNNTLYVAKKTLDIPIGKGDRSISGGGTFKVLGQSRILTDTAQDNRSVWRLPEWVFPRTGRKPLTYHPNASQWAKNSDGSTRLQTVGRGQEFVLDVDQYPEARGWLTQIFST